ncbi:NB-ARC domain-containing protein [Micromonospora aurantiaca]|uniref:NB-ARC domain-containing protein n=1 Tax=Micromonospora aurantiaca (nom. illeg.) TaxID=47850 RepID=UPI0033E53963
MDLLPGPPLFFTDRVEPLAEAVARVDAARAREVPAFVWLTGPQGVGKTALALFLAHNPLGQYGEVRLYDELGGSTPGGRANPSDVLAHFLYQLGRKIEDIPARQEERYALFRSLTAGRRILMFLDDVHDAAQVNDLLPSAPQAVVIVTSRHRHDRLYQLGFDPIELETLTKEHSASLLAELLPAEVVSAEPEALRDLAELCDGLPLALTVAAVRIRRHRQRPVALLVELLRERSPLEVLHLDGDRVISMLLDFCVDDLTPSARRAYRLLGLHPGPDFGAAVVSEVLQAATADDVLDELCAAHLLHETSPNRFRFHHALIARHAHSLAMVEEDESNRLRAVATIVSWYAYRAVALARVVSGRWWVNEAFARIDPAYAGAQAQRQARTELETERPNMHAAVHAAEQAGLDSDCVLLCEALWPWYYDTDREVDLLEAMPLGVAAAERIGDVRQRMRLLHDLGAAAEKAGRHDQALAAFRAVRELAAEVNDIPGEESAVEWQGIVLAQIGRFEEALDLLDEAWQIAQRVPEPQLRERMLHLLRLHIARVRADFGRPEKAYPLLQEADAYFTIRDEPINAARTAQTLGRVLLMLGRPDAGQARAKDAVALFLQHKARAKALRTMQDMASAAAAVGELAQARAWFEQAHVLASELGLLITADEIMNQLDELRP